MVIIPFAYALNLIKITCVFSFIIFLPYLLFPYVPAHLLDCFTYLWITIKTQTLCFLLHRAAVAEAPCYWLGSFMSRAGLNSGEQWRGNVGWSWAQPPFSQGRALGWGIAWRLKTRGTCPGYSSDSRAASKVSMMELLHILSWTRCPPRTAITVTMSKSKISEMENGGEEEQSAWR